jgi:hypothetical protein
MKRLIVFGAIFAFALTSCGESEPIAVQTTETSTTVSFGSDCSTEDHERIFDLAIRYNEEKKIQAGLTKSAWLKEIQELRDALTVYRSNVRVLDLPTLVDQQKLVVDEIEVFLAALNRFTSSDSKDTSYLDASIPMADALYDFSVSYNELCGG